MGSMTNTSWFAKPADPLKSHAIASGDSWIATEPDTCGRRRRQQAEPVFDRAAPGTVHRRRADRVHGAGVRLSVVGGGVSPGAAGKD
jgi:hypothetical protein